jgi:hypothetical protein
MSAYTPLRGGAVIQFYVSSTLAQWPANTFLGLGNDGPSATPGLVLAWIAPGPGVVNNLTVNGLQRNLTGSALTVTMCKNAASPSPTYPATTLFASVVSQGTTGAADPLASFTTLLGDMLVAKISGNWGGGISVSALWTPSA